MARSMKEGCGWQNGMKLSLLTSHASVCNTTMVGFESGDTVETGSFADRKHVVHGCSTIDPDYTPSCQTRSTLATCGSCLVCCTPRTHPKSL
ncbi:hypothetical protein TNCV_3645611 [Trichonephila clavipes]|nr:hypothetical protein TNCV_3645611 [Trichonephila clavipes]